MVTGRWFAVPGGAREGLRWQGSVALVGASGRVAATLLSIPVLVHYLGLVGYGTWSVMVAITNLSSLAVLGLPGATSYFVARSAGRAHEGLHGLIRTTGLAVVTLALAYCATIILLAAPLSRLFLDGSIPDSSQLVMLSGLLAFTHSLRQWIVGVQIGLERWDLAAGLEGAINVATLAISATGAVLWGTVRALALSSLVASVVGLALQAILLRSVLSPVMAAGGRESASLKLPIWAYGRSLWLGQLGGLLFGQVDRIAIAAYLGPASAGLYSLATSIGGRINEISAAAASVLAPAVTRALAAGDQALARSRLVKSFRIINFLVLSLAGGVLSFAPPLALLLSERSANAFGTLLFIVIPAYAMFSVNAPGHYAAHATGHPLIAAQWALISGLVFTASLFLGLHHNFGLSTVAYANYAFSLTLIVNLKSVTLLGASGREVVYETAKFTSGLGAVVLITNQLSRTSLGPVSTSLLSLAALACILAAMYGSLLLMEVNRRLSFRATREGKVSL